MAKMGRPRKELDYDKFERLCELQLTEEDMCHTFGMNSDTLNARLKEHYGLTFSEVFGQKRMGGLNSLRSEAFRRARKGSDTMLIFLLKNWCGMADKQTIDQTIKNQQMTYEEKLKIVKDLMDKEPEEQPIVENHSLS